MKGKKYRKEARKENELFILLAKNTFTVVPRSNLPARPAHMHTAERTCQVTGTRHGSKRDNIEIT